MVLREIKCETTDCEHNARVRTIKKELVRVYSKESIGNDVDLHYEEVIMEKFMCLSCANHTNYKIVEWLFEKVPLSQLFSVKGFSLKDAEKLGRKYWDVDNERRLRWNEQKFCQNCGHTLKHEKRYYSDDDGYDSPSRWINVHRVIICENCGLFDYQIRCNQIAYSRKAEQEGKYHGWSGPHNDPDYKKWKDALKKKKDLNGGLP